MDDNNNKTNMKTHKCIYVLPELTFNDLIFELNLMSFSFDSGSIIVAIRVTVSVALFVFSFFQID